MQMTALIIFFFFTMQQFEAFSGSLAGQLVQIFLLQLLDLLDPHRGQYVKVLAL